MLGEHGVQAAVALLGGAPVALDPARHQLQHLGFQVHRPPLGVAAAADQPGVLQHLQVLGDRLHAHLVGLRELADRGVPDRQPGHDVAPGRVRQGGEEPGQLVCHDPSSTNRLNKGYGPPTSVVNHLVVKARSDDHGHAAAGRARRAPTTLRVLSLRARPSRRARRAAPSCSVPGVRPLTIWISVTCLASAISSRTTRSIGSVARSSRAARTRSTSSRCSSALAPPAVAGSAV